MNQKRQGGQGRQQQRPAQQQDMTANEQISQQDWAKRRISDIVHSVTAQQKVIEAVMPVGVGFDRFRATLLMLLRTNPSILECTTASIVQCSIRAAYDGVNLDGVEAAAIPSNNKYEDQNGGKYTLREARYNIMVAGVRRQIMATGQLLDPPETVIIYENEEFEENIEGGQRTITHRKLLKNRGEMVGVYSMARLKSGNMSYEVMTFDDIVALKTFASQKGAVWGGKMESEMWRKSVLRRHKKTLLGADARPDSEEIEMFPDNPANAAALPPPRARPQRSDYQALQDQSGTAAGMEMDLGFSQADVAMSRTFAQAEDMARENQQVDQNAGRQQSGGHNERNTAENGDTGADHQGSDQGKADPPTAQLARIPGNAEDWAQWESFVMEQIENAPSVPALNGFWREQQHILNAAIDVTANRVNDAFSDAIADLTTNPPSGDAGAPQGGNDAPAGGN